MPYIGTKPENIIATAVDTTTGKFSGEVDAASLDISGDVDVDGILEADAITLNGTAIGSIYSPIAGGTGILTTGALNSGSITSGFGAIDTGSSNITSTGVGSFGSLDISGDIDVDGVTNLDVVDIDGAVDMASTLAVAGVASFADGTVSAPALTFNSDTNMGLYRGGTDILKFVTAGTDAITIDASQNVTMAGTLDVVGGLVVDGNDSYTSNIKFDYGSSAPTYFANWGYKSSSDGNKVFLTITDNGTAKDVLVANYNGNVFVAKTAENVAVVGHELRSSGFLASTRDGATVSALTRLSSNGTILEFRKDSSSIGIIGTNGELGIGDEDVGIYFSPSTDSIIPCNPASSFANRANAIDLGYSSVPFQDIYLSGGVFVGGTGTANHLDDYEEGTWTPQVNFGGNSTGIAYTSRVGHYTKIGRMVYASFDIVLSNKGSSTGGATVDGLPVANYGSSQNNAGTVISEGGGVDWPQSGVYGMVWSDGNIYIRYQNTTAYTDVSNAKFSNTTKLFGMMVYETT
jgi:cytoskeletal protein CcmA (bactofilin family)